MARKLTAPVILTTGAGLLSLPIYLLSLAYGPFRPGRIIGFFPLFAGVFLLYGLATWAILRLTSASVNPIPRWFLPMIVGMAILFNLILLLNSPTLSDDMYRYVWDGRVQNNGINPYSYAPSAPEFYPLRDNAIYTWINRKDVVTIYPPGAEFIFRLTWQFFGDSILAFKAVMVSAVLLGGLLLIPLLRAFGGRPERILIFLWNPLLIFEIAHSGHVDGLYLPCIIGAMLLRAIAPTDRVNWRHEIGIGVLIGMATLFKLYPLILLVPLWNVRDSEGQRRYRFILPMATAITIGIGYSLYIAPHVDTLGFLPEYGHEFFNIGPLPMALLNWAEAHNIAFYLPVNTLMPLGIIVASLYFLIVPARSAREAVLRCMIPIGIYLIISENLFSWYVLFMLPLIALSLEWRIDASFAWWLFTGLVVLSYTLFITGWAQDWAMWVQFLPLYLMLIGGYIFKRLPGALPALIRKPS
jgi:hypothetical protein